MTTLPRKPRPWDSRDIAIETLSDTELELRERIRSLEEDVARYRELAVEGIHYAHSLTRQLQAAQRQITALRDELRRYTSRTISPTPRAA